jgi:hypothetical protein
MSLQAIFEIAIGLIFAWLVLSLVAMYAQEWIVTQLRWRSGMLEAYIRNMLADPAMSAQFYDHPLIQALHSGKNGDHRPSYIPSSQFTLALFDILMSAGTESSLLQQEIYKLQSNVDMLRSNKKKLAQVQIDLALTATRKALNTPAGDATLRFTLNNAKAALGTLAELDPQMKTAVSAALGNVQVNKGQVDTILASIQEQSDGGWTENPTLDQIRLGVAALSVTQPQLKQALSSLLNGVKELTLQGDSVLGLARKNVEQWFDGGMDRLSGWYKRRSQKLAFVIGICVAFALNTDTLQLAQTLWREPLMRQALAAQAQAYVDQNQSGVSTPTAQQLYELQAQFADVNIPVGWIGTPLSAQSNGVVPMADGTEKMCTPFPHSNIDLYGVAVANQCYPIINAPHLDDLTGILLKVIGLLASGLAAAQGAPFWFDILKKIINIRTSGSNPAESQAAPAAG